jgi:hypothetical protein
LRAEGPIEIFRNRNFVRMKAAAILVSGFLGLLGVADVALSQSSEEPIFASLINAERTSRGLEPLSPDEALLPVARPHSARMAREGRVFHNRNLPNEVIGWYVLGENVGRGSSVEVIHEAFMNSPTHQAEILDPQYHGFAVGAAASGGQVWVTELFVLRERPVVAGKRVTSPPEQQLGAPERMPVSVVSRPPEINLPASLRFTIEENYATPSLIALAVLLICIDGHLLRLARSSKWQGR